MKRLKIALVLLMILGITIALFFFLSGGLDSLSSLFQKDYVSLGEQFNEEWDEANTWNADLFKKQMQMIEEIPQPQNAEFLRDIVSKRATDIVFNTLMMEWESPTCSKAVVEENIKALHVIESQDLKAASNVDIMLPKDIYKVYETADKLVSQPVALEPQFNGVSWNSFSSYKSKLQSQKHLIEENINYQKYLSNISAIKNYFEDLNNNLSAANKKFAADLEQEICAYYQNAARTPAKLANFRNVYARYTAEFSSNSRIKDLLQRFTNDVERTLKRDRKVSPKTHTSKQ